MKKIVVIAVVLLSLLLGFYLLLPWMGVNIHFSELVGRNFSVFTSDVRANENNQAIELKKYITGLDNPRFMYVTKTGDLLVSEPHKGQILLFPYNKPQHKKILLSKLKKPHSVDVFEGFLYVAEENAIGRIQFNAQTGQTVGEYERVIENLPDDGGHWTRTIKFGPDGYGYVSIGSSCNACIEKNKLRATISRFKPGDKQLEVYASGLRNSVGFDWSPSDGQMYATDNARDWLGDHFPPDELNVIKKGKFYGWPFANGNNVPDPKYGEGHKEQIQQALPPVHEFGAHNAPLGITFIKNKHSPLYQQALVALHGSWNSSVKVGYKVVALKFINGEIKQRDFINAFLKDGRVLGRPVHIVEGKDGELYLSDDHNGVIYRITLQ